jgi:hypothetical protein
MMKRGEDQQLKKQEDFIKQFPQELHYGDYTFIGILG